MPEHADRLAELVEVSAARVALGEMCLESEAIARAGSRIGLADDVVIPDALKGYAAIALERQLVDPVMTELGWGFAPADGTTRLAAAKGLLQLRDILAGTAVAPGAGPIVDEQPTVHLEIFKKRPRR